MRRGLVLCRDSISFLRGWCRVVVRFRSGSFQMGPTARFSVRSIDLVTSVVGLVGRAVWWLFGRNEGVRRFGGSVRGIIGQTVARVDSEAFDLGLNGHPRR